MPLFCEIKQFIETFGRDGMHAQCSATVCKNGNLKISYNLQKNTRFKVVTIVMLSSSHFSVEKLYIGLQSFKFDLDIS